jgi:hypothetical protein
VTPGARVKVRVIPRAGRNEVAGLRNDALLVRLQAAPVDGAANHALVRLLSDVLHVRPSDIRIASGGRSRDKVLEVEGLTEEEVMRALRGDGAGG